MKHGFDLFFGLPYVNDMDRVPGKGPKGRAAFFEPKIEYWNVPLMRDDQIIERPADQHTLTKRYTEESVKFIKSNTEKPFFLYLAYAMPHVPLFASKDFEGKSPRGLYGDVVEELDWSVGEVLKAVRDNKLDRKTLVVFTSDNGPWLMFGEHGGSAGLLREGKGSTWEGGMRVPGIAWWPGTVPAGATTQELACNMDLFNTSIALAGGKVPDDRPIDGFDITPVLMGKGKSPRDTMFFYRDEQLYAIRHGKYKAHFMTRPGYGTPTAVKHDPPALYDLGRDPCENTDVAKNHPDVIAEMKILARHQSELKPSEPQLEKKLPAVKK
jgi:arylsulfatase A-like enzyme